MTSTSRLISEVDPALVVPGEAAEQHADRDEDRDGDEADGHRDPRAEDQARGDVAPVQVAAEPVHAVGTLERAARRLGPELADVVGVVMDGREDRPSIVEEARGGLDRLELGEPPRILDLERGTLGGIQAHLFGEVPARLLVRLEVGGARPPVDQGRRAAPGPHGQGERDEEERRERPARRAPGARPDEAAAGAGPQGDPPRRGRRRRGAGAPRRLRRSRTRCRARGRARAARRRRQGAPSRRAPPRPAAAPSRAAPRRPRRGGRRRRRLKKTSTPPGNTKPSNSRSRNGADQVPPVRRTNGTLNASTGAATATPSRTFTQASANIATSFLRSCAPTTLQ